MRSKQIKAEEDEEKEQMRNVENEIKAAEKQTKALAVRQTKRPARKRPPEPAQVHPQEQLEDDEAALQAEEDEARAKMEAAVRARKRFVKNQKAILAALQAKKDEKARRREEQEQEQERQRELKRKRNEKFLKQRELKKSEQEQQEEEQAAAMVEATVGVGSALSAIRATRSQEGGQLGKTRRAPVGRSTSATVGPSTPKDKEGEEDIPKKERAPRRRLKKVLETVVSRKEREKQEKEKEEEPEDPAIKEKRREDARLRQEKVSQQLALLTEQRKEAEEAAKRKEERAKVRAELLRQRVQLEYNERKQMAIEDQYVNGDIKMKKPKMGAVVPVEEKPKKKKITTEMAEAMVDRMQVKKLKAKNAAEGKEGLEPSIADVASLLPPARDFMDWKKKHGVPPNTRVFCMTGWYPCVKDELLSRGWVFNPDPASPHFDLKWTLKSSDVTKGSLQPWQLTNHYLKNVALTTKIGLMKSLQQLNWVADVSPDDIFPRGYDLSSPLEIQEYLDDFRHDHVVNLMKQLYLRVTGLETPVVNAAPLPSPRPEMNSPDSCKGQPAGGGALPVPMTEHEVSPPPSPITNIDKFMVNKAVLNACFAVLARYLNPHFAENGIDQDITADTKTITAMEWEIVERFDLYVSTILPDVTEEPIDDFLREKEREAEMSAAQALPNMEKRKALSDINQRSRKEQYRNDKERERASDALTKMIPLGQEGLLKLHTFLSQCKIVSCNQYGLNGNASQAKNMWIVKPAAKSRGRGIMAFNDLRKLLAYVELGKAGKSILTSSQWIVQKYMENPLIIANRKFDFRQWVLVVSWNPLTIYFYDEFYCRFSSEDYDTSDEAMSNTFVHLVNNSIGKNNENFHKSIQADNGEDIKEFMWSDKNFTDYVKHSTKSDETIVKIKNRMKDIAIWSLMCGADAIEHRKNSWELYGFDYMMDDAWNPWLIEINSSPACDYSTKVTERYVKKALVEVLNVTLDVRDWEKQPKSSRGDKPDTGGWECIYTGPTLETNTSFGTDMCVQGEPMKLPRKKQPVATLQRLHVLASGGKDDDEEDNDDEDAGVGPKRGGSSTSNVSTRPTKDNHASISRSTPSNMRTMRVSQGSSDSLASPQQKQHQSELQHSPIETASDMSKVSSPRTHSVSIANLVEQKDTSGLKTQAAPITFDDSDDDFSVEHVESEKVDVAQATIQALDKLENAELTAQVRAMVAVPLTTQQFEVPTVPAVEAANETRQILKKGQGLKTKRISSGTRNLQEGQGGAAAIPIKTYDPFA
jgi:tubulin monoglycylase TTLL3/8